MARWIPVDAPRNQLPSEAMPGRDVLVNGGPAQCEDPVVSTGQITDQDVEVHDGTPCPAVGAGPVPAFFRISHAVDAATFTPRPASSPWIRR